MLHVMPAVIRAISIILCRVRLLPFSQKYKSLDDSAKRHLTVNILYLFLDTEMVPQQTIVKRYTCTCNPSIRNTGYIVGYKESNFIWKPTDKI